MTIPFRFRASINPAHYLPRSCPHCRRLAVGGRGEGVGEAEGFAYPLNLWQIGHGFPARWFMPRHTDYTEEKSEEICSRIACGESLRSICKSVNMPSIASVMRWLNSQEIFRERYARAREIQAEYLLDEIIEISDDGTNDYMQIKDRDGNVIGWRENGEFVNRSRLRVDTRKWAASKMYPRKYGDKAEVSVRADIKTTTRRLDISELDDDQLDAFEVALRSTVAQLKGKTEDGQK